MIFLDVNLPPDEKELFDKKWVHEIAETIEPTGGKSKDGLDQFNLIVVTNHPEHYGDIFEPAPGKNTASVLANVPQNLLQHPHHLIDIHNAAEQYGISRWSSPRAMIASSWIGITDRVINWMAGVK